MLQGSFYCHYTYLSSAAVHNFRLQAFIVTFTSALLCPKRLQVLKPDSALHGLPEAQFADPGFEGNARCVARVRRGSERRIRCECIYAFIARAFTSRCAPFQISKPSLQWHPALMPG